MEGNISITMHYYCTLLCLTMAICAVFGDDLEKKEYTTNQHLDKLTRGNMGFTSELLNEPRTDTSGIFYQLLKRQDRNIDVIRGNAVRYVEQFLKSGSIETGKMAVNLTNIYEEEREFWISVVIIISHYSHNESFYNEMRLKERIEEYNNMQAVLYMVSDIYFTAVDLFNLYHENYLYLSISEFHGDNYDEVIFSINKAFSYLKELEASVTDLDKKWNDYLLNISFVFPWKNYFNFIIEEEQRIKSLNETVEKTLLEIQKRERVSAIFQHYVYPFVYVIILVVGILGNGTLLFIFARHKEIRKPPNIMLFNLALADVTNLCINSPLYYMFKYYSEAVYVSNLGCKVYVTFRFLNTAVIELSILSLSAQRYIATVSALHTREPCCTLTPRTVAIIYIVTVWIVSLIISLPPTLVFELSEGDCFPVTKQNVAAYQVIDVFYCLFDALFLPIMIATFSILTARLLRRSVRDMPGVVRNNAQEIARYRSARMVTALAIAFAISFIPRSIWFFVASFAQINRREVLFICIDEITNYFMFANSCLNPIALYSASRVFRKLFNNYLFRCFCSRDNKHIDKTPVTRTTSLQPSI